MYKNKMFYIKCGPWWNVTQYIYLTLCLYSAVVVFFHIKIAFLKHVIGLWKPQDENENNKKILLIPFQFFFFFLFI